uniref:Uncharacterized protein n=1 Tax=Nelumbo nucifera TaxID=4432 RepID=A0A822Y7W1_NELNU|nr:TPA_asm: hypothetical protein HUJ06_029820 [Nelumbo nucifera]
MAEDLDDGEFWLPSQFLTDDDILMDLNNFRSNKGFATDVDAPAAFFPCDFPPHPFPRHGSPTALSSPVESLVGSTETESDEEDYLAGSPQSTLCTVGSWSGRSGGSSRGSPNGPSQVSSPPSTPLNGKDDAWDLLNAAAGQVVRMKMNDDEVPNNHHQGRGVLGPPRKPSPVPVPVKTPTVSAGFYSNQVFTHQQMQSNQFQQLKRQQLMKQQFSAVWGRPGKIAGATHQPQAPQQQQLQNRSRAAGFGNGRYGGRPLGLSSSAWPPLQQQPQAGSGMRAVFLGVSGTRRECSGTGVFLPRRIGNPAESRKKPACSTVLLPARVVQALNLNFDDLGARPRIHGVFAATENVGIADPVTARSNASLSQKKMSYRPQGSINHEIRLPQDWTY